MNINNEFGTKNVFVTLFASNYLSRGLTLYESLASCCKDYFLYIIAFDDLCYEILKKLNLTKTRIISLEEFEDEELEAVKKDRSIGEYCWTSTPKSILYVFEHYNESICTYIDADLMFFDDPKVLISEVSEEYSVMITEHRYSDYCDQSDYAGIYNVQFMTFKNDTKAIEVLEWWKNKCLQDCCVDVSRGLCGDQKYLDDWKERFTCVHVMENFGGGVAPWNVSRYSFTIKAGRVHYESDGGENGHLIFFHFHSVKFYDKGVIGLAPGMYIIPDSAVAYIYKKFVKMHNYVLSKYHLEPVSKLVNEQHFRDDNTDYLKKDKNYYLVDLFL